MPSGVEHDLIAAAESAALAAANRLNAAERALEEARAEYGRAVRRFHLAGATVREVAQALGISHQRVHQLVDAGGGSWWSRAWSSRRREGLACSFCGRSAADVDKLIAGPHVYICDACVERAADELAGVSAPAGDAAFARLPLASRARCSFCGKTPAAGRELVSGGAHRVCGACLEISREIILAAR